MVQAFRERAVAGLTGDIGVYALCDLDSVPLYVGQSTDGIRARVQRHLTSARSDIIANRQIDLWEVAEIWAWPVADVAVIRLLEAQLFTDFDRLKPLMNGSVMLPPSVPAIVPLHAVTAVLPDDERERRRDPVRRLPRQIEHIARLVDHILNVKDSPQLRRSLAAHFDRLDAYRAAFLQAGTPVVTRVAEEE